VSPPGDALDLRQLVREVLRELAPPVPVDAGEPSTQDGGEPVRLTTDAELDAFVRRLLTMFDNPKLRADLRTGKLRFRLAPPTVHNGQPAARRHVDKGAVTERQVVDAARAGVSLVLARRAVLTPLARDKARALGVVIEREQ
jgi:hypothetical protein